MFSKTVCVTEPEKYPVIKKFIKGAETHETIVLFNGPQNGTVLCTDFGFYKVGEYRTDWIESNFAVCNDIVILCNDSKKLENTDVGGTVIRTEI